MSHGHDDFAFEPIPGLPARPPQDEAILWQGAPDWRHLAVRAFHVRKVFVYFGLLALWRIAAGLYDGDVGPALFMSVSVLAAMALATAFILCLIAWSVARSTVYTITSRRVVMRFGVALPMTVNLPFAQVDGVALRPDSEGVGDIALTLARGKGFSYMVLWPHVRPWQFSYPAPMLRSVPKAAEVVATLAQAFAARHPARFESEAAVDTPARPTLVAAE
ncbi:MAG: photosynthetic complex putative assembly protein PuhB [Alsobacter sp.]